MPSASNQSPSFASGSCCEGCRTSKRGAVTDVSLCRLDSAMTRDLRNTCQVLRVRLDRVPGFLPGRDASGKPLHLEPPARERESPFGRRVALEALAVTDVDHVGVEVELLGQVAVVQVDGAV